MQSHAFYVQRVEPWCRVYLRIPYGGVYSDHEAQGLRLHRVLHWLPEFLREARSRCRHLRLLDSMGDAQLKLESIDGDETLFRYSTDQMARKYAKVSDLLEAQSDLQLERWLTQ
jgi:hypothetical protein